MQPEILTAIKPVLLVLLPVLYGIAEMIKITPLKRWLIPFILWGVSIVLTISVLFTEQISFQNDFVGIFQGTLIAMMTVGGNQFIKQATEKRNSDKKTENGNKTDGNNG